MMKHRHAIAACVAIFCFAWNADAQQAPKPWYPKPGDIILFKDQDAAHQTIGVALGDDTSHAAVVVRDKNGDLQLMHAVGKHHSVDPVAIAKNKKQGVVFEPLLDYLKASTKTDRIFVRRMLVPFDEKTEKRMTEWVYRQLGKPYSDIKADTLLAIPPIGPTLHKARPAVTEPASQTCSGFVGTFCISAGFIPPTYNPDAVMPIDLFTDRRLEADRARGRIDLRPDRLIDPGIDLKQFYEKPVEIVFPKEPPPPAKKAPRPREG